MPTLIRLIVALAFLVGIGYAGMFALAVLVQPDQKQITVRIPARTFADIAPITDSDSGPPRSVAGQPPSALPDLPEDNDSRPE